MITNVMIKKHLEYDDAESTASFARKRPAQELKFNGRSLEPWVRQYQGPTYIYDLDLLKNRFQIYQEFLPGVSVHYALKANSDRKILRTLQKLGARIDAVSQGEIQRAFECGFKPRDILFSGVAKTQRELEFAIESQIHQINVESLSELRKIAQVSENLQKKVSVALRLNPDVEIKTHRYIATGLMENKFGLELAALPEVIEILKASPRIELAGVSLHLGSQMLEFGSFQEALSKIKTEFLKLRSAFPSCNRFDFGGGLGILYDEINPERELQLLESYAQVIEAELGKLQKEGVEIQSEPGRWLVAHSGVLLCQIQYIKKTSHKTFLIVDSGMNHLIRPSLYDAYHWIGPWIRRGGASEVQQTVDVVGPICESSDFFSRGQKIGTVEEGDFLIVADCGAYSASMASDYNLRERAFEVHQGQG